LCRDLPVYARYCLLSTSREEKQCDPLDIFRCRITKSCCSAIPHCPAAMSTPGAWAQATEEELRMGSRDKRVGWYTPTLDNVSAVQRDLLETYSNIPPHRVIPHILAVVCALICADLFLTKNTRPAYNSCTNALRVTARSSLGDPSISVRWRIAIHRPQPLSNAILQLSA
jgi:hypothetical protein